MILSQLPKLVTMSGNPCWKKGAITFDPADPSGPASAARANHQALLTLESFPDVPLNQDASLPEHSVSPPSQLTPVQMAPAHLQFPPKG